jgi:hypothetical protein
MSVHAQHGAGFFVDQESAPGKLRAQLHSPNGLGIAMAGNEPLRGQLEGDPLHRLALVVGEGEVEVETNVANRLESQGAVDEDLPLGRRRSVTQGMPEEVVDVGGFEAATQMGVEALVACAHGQFCKRVFQDRPQGRPIIAYLGSGGGGRLRSPGFSPQCGSGKNRPGQSSSRAMSWGKNSSAEASI